CHQAHVDFAAPTCQSMRGDGVDAAVTQTFLAAIQPAQLAISMATLEDLEARPVRLSASGNSGSSGCATRLIWPGAGFWPSIRRIGWWRGAWNGTGTQNWPPSRNWSTNMPRCPRGQLGR